MAVGCSTHPLLLLLLLLDLLLLLLLSAVGKSQKHHSVLCAPGDITLTTGQPLAQYTTTPHAGECQAEYECLMSCDGRRASQGWASSPAECCMRPGVGGYVVGAKASGDCHDCWDSGPLQPFSSSMSAICSV